MSRDGSIELDFADGTYRFRLGWGDLVRLQEARDTGPFLLLNRLLNGAWRVEDIAEVIRCGLVGGGLEPHKALGLVRAYVQDRPPLETLVIAQRVLGAGLAGAGEEELVGKKAEAADPEAETPRSRTESSGSPPSTEAER